MKFSLKTIKLFFISSVVLVFGCKAPDFKAPEILDAYQEVNMDTISAFTPYKKYFVTGNFTGENKKDTISLHYFSGLQNKEIFERPDRDWDVVQSWFSQQKGNMNLNINNPAYDTLDIGFGWGLYYLNNIGDINGDGKDEVAYTVNYLDYSQINSCQIYTFCNNKWTELKRFTILESAFDNFNNNSFDSTQIKDYFELKDGKWYYTDYNGEDNGNIMVLLKVDKCK